MKFIMESFVEHFLDLLTAIRTRYQGDIDREVEGCQSLQIAVEHIGACTTLQNIPDPQRLPGCDLLFKLFAAPHSEEIQPLVKAFAAIEADLVWQQNPNYTDEKMGIDGYLQKYGYTELMGPRGIVHNCEVIIGFLLLGPDLLYPRHHHPAAEVYHVVNGTAEWFRGDGEWQPKPPGSAIYHAPWVTHGTRTGQESLLALYCWTGQVEVNADLC